MERDWIGLWCIRHPRQWRIMRFVFRSGVLEGDANIWLGGVDLFGSEWGDISWGFDRGFGCGVDLGWSAVSLFLV